MKKQTFNLSLALVSSLLMGCALSLNAQGPTYEWARQLGGTDFDAGNAIAADNAGNVYVTGGFKGTADFNPGSGATDTAFLTSAGDYDIFITKLDSAGNFVWAKRIGSNGNDRSWCIKADNLGHIYIAGQFNRTVDFNPGSGVDQHAAYGSDAFLLKLDTAGNFIWVNPMGGTGTSDAAYGLTLDDFGNVYVTGEYGKTGVFDPEKTDTNAILNAIGSTNLFIAKFDTTGKFNWVKSMGGNKSDYGYSIATDDLGNVYTTGYFSSDSANFNPGSNRFRWINNGNYDIFVSKLDSSGNFIWAKTIGGQKADFSTGIAIDQDRNLYITGKFSGAVDFNPGTGTSVIAAGPTDAFICKMDQNGNFAWVKNMGGSGATNIARMLALDSRANVYVTGYFQGTVDFNIGPNPFILTAPLQGNTDPFIMSVDSAGNFLWAKDLHGAGTGYGYDIATDYHSNIYTTGYFNDTFNFDPGVGNMNMVSSGGFDAFVHKMSQCVVSRQQIVEVSCGDYTLNGKTYTESGTYTQATYAQPCDSTIIILDLTINRIIHPMITVSGFELSTAVPYATYQWFIDDNLIPGATNRNYTVVKNGDYTVVVTDTVGCTDTSDIYRVTNADNSGIEDRNTLSQSISIYPNPSNDVVHIITPIKVNAVIMSIEGKTIKQIADANQISLKEFADGMYLLKITDQQGYLIKTEKLIKASSN